MWFFRILAWLAIGPAVWVNIEATPMPWKPWAVGSVILASVFVYVAWEKSSFWFGVLGAIFTLINLGTALGNVANMSADTIDGRSSIVERRDAVNARRAELNAARKVQVALAGETAVGVFEGQIKSLIASDATRYAASEHCNPDKTSKTETKAFCDQIAGLETKQAAAEERVKIDAKLGEVDKETIFGGPSAKDPYAESLARFLSVFGYRPTDESKLLLSASKDWGRAIGLELMAAFGPMGLVALFELMLAQSAPIPATNLPAPERRPEPVILSEVPHAPVATVMEPDEPVLLPKPRPAKKRATAAEDAPTRPDVDPRILISILKDLITEDGRLYYSDAEERLRTRYRGIAKQKIGRMLSTLGTRSDKREKRPGSAKREYYYEVRAA